MISGSAALEGICGKLLQLHTFRLAYPAITGLQNPGQGRLVRDTKS
jgi:hypothetical protein